MEVKEEHQTPTQEEIAWFAGFYEAEGCTYINKTNANRIGVSICQNDPYPIYLAQKYWGGNVSKSDRKSPASDKRCISYSIVMNHNTSLKFLSDIEPYMIIPYKINQIKTKMNEFLNYEKKEIKCELCDRVYTHPGSLKTHMNIEHKEDNSVYECKECNLTYKTKATLAYHIKSKHKNKDVTYECELCDSTYTTKYGLKKHMDTKHINVGKVYTCAICGNNYQNVDSLNKHKREKHK